MTTTDNTTGRALSFDRGRHSEVSLQDVICEARTVLDELDELEAAVLAAKGLKEEARRLERAEADHRLRYWALFDTIVTGCAVSPQEAIGQLDAARTLIEGLGGFAMSSQRIDRDGQKLRLILESVTRVLEAAAGEPASRWQLDRRNTVPDDQQHCCLATPPAEASEKTRELRSEPLTAVGAVNLFRAAGRDAQRLDELLTVAKRQREPEEKIAALAAREQAALAAERQALEDVIVSRCETQADFRAKFAFVAEEAFDGDESHYLHRLLQGLQADLERLTLTD